MSTDRAREVWEVERDRFGVMFSGPLEVGECIRVVSLDAILEFLREAGDTRFWNESFKAAAHVLEAEFGVPQPEQPA